MLQKILSLAFGALLIGYLFFKPQLAKFGQRVDRVVTFMVIAIALTWTGQLAYFLLTRR